jgi:beta-phosphoglucomutase-like phosphatase (HAD superfamily)
MFNMAAEGLKLPKNRCIIMEDSKSGFKAAENAQMAYVVISHGSDPNDLQYASQAAAIHDDYTNITVDMLRNIVNS